MIKNKRFIAGATCPECREIDKIYTYKDEADKTWRACVSCEFKESTDSINQQQELPTRVNQNRMGEQPLAHETAVEVVRMLDPSSNSDK